MIAIKIKTPMEFNTVTLGKTPSYRTKLYRFRIFFRLYLIVYTHLQGKIFAYRLASTRGKVDGLKGDRSNEDECGGNGLEIKEVGLERSRKFLCTCTREISQISVKGRSIVEIGAKEYLNLNFSSIITRNHISFEF